jgi:hypothetical protein
MHTLARPTALVRALAVAGLAAALFASGPAHAAPKSKSQTDAAIAELIKKVDALAAQNQALQEKVDRLEAAQAQQQTQATQQAAAVQQQGSQLQQQAAVVQQTQAQVKQEAEATAQAATTSQRAGWAASTTVSAYGEIGYSRPTENVAASNTDVARAVIGMQHRFDDRTRMTAEWEWEHAVTSSDDAGESEVEQLWVEREFDNGVRGRAGLFLMPVGLLNQNHEPTAYYGVFRPDVDTKIIPSTWREAGLGATGDLGNGLNWDVAVTTAPNLSAWDASSTEGRDRGPLQAIHGEGQFAASRTFGGVAALNWRGVPGLWVGGSIVYDNIGQSQPEFPGNGSKLLLLDAHARYQVAGLDVSGEIVRGTISNTEALNQSYFASAIPDPTYVPHLFYGGYAQAAYKVFQHGDYALSPFVRYEIYNTAAGFGSLPASLGAVKQPDEHVLTIGANFYIGEGVVLKADYRDYRVNKAPDTEEHFNLGNSLNLGVGFSF